MCGAVLALMQEVVLWQSSRSYRGLPLGEAWALVDTRSLGMLRAAVTQYLHPALWEHGIAAVLGWRGWAVLGLLGLVLLGFDWLKGRVRRR